ncbi:MAG: DUF2799 domain-containing protein [Pseudobdellovibrionaceae bacterium]
MIRNVLNESSPLRLKALVLILTLIGISFLVSSCASLIKKSCESKNWYQHGYDLAMTGKRPAGDVIVEQCKKVETISESDLDRGFKAGMWDYCKPEIVRTKGKEGEFFNFDFCDPGQLGMLKQTHSSGVKEYCAVDNGFTAGAKGKPYNNICPKNAEKAFVKEFNKGRKSFLSARVKENKSRIEDLDKRSSDLAQQKMQTQIQLSYIPAPQTIRERTLNPVNNMWEERTRTEDPNANKRFELESKVRSLDQQAHEQKTESDKLKNETYQLEREVATFE